MAETPTKNVFSVPAGRVLARNTLFNLGGHIIPLLVAFLAIPALIKGLGTERFGVLSLIWMAVGYFSLFDLGIGRATTKMVAENIARRESEDLPHLIWTSLGMLFGFGLTGALLLCLLNPLLVTAVFNLPGYLRSETSGSLYLIAASLPLVLGTAGVRGILEAQQRFALINAIKIPVASALIAAPLVVMMFSNSLYPITLALLGIRLVECLAYSFFCLRSFSHISRPRWPSIDYAKQLLGFGGWLTVTNIVGPLMTYLDRFVIGGLLSVAAVAYYTTPYDVVSRLAVIPGSLMSVMFPAFSASLAVDAEIFATLFESAVKKILIVMSPLVIVMVLAAYPFLDFWVGREFAEQSTLVFQLLAVGTLINAVGQVPFGALQAMGHPEVTAKVHLLELPLYLGMIGFLVMKMGIVGAACAWVIRVSVDTMILMILVRRRMPARVFCPPVVRLAENKE